MSWLDWLIAPVCPLCDRPTASGMGCFCRDCAVQLQPLRRSEWIKAPVEEGQVSLGKRSLLVYCWGPYDGILNRVIRQFKYEGHPEIGDTLGEWMGEKWNVAITHNRAQQSSPKESKSSKRLRKVPKQNYTIMPIPLHRDRRRDRGFNQAEVMARRFCEITGDRLEANVLGRVQATVPQYGLSADERQENVEQAFGAMAAADYRFGGQPVILFDDIFTTGSTLLAARTVLEQQGWRVVAAVVAARAGE